VAGGNVFNFRGVDFRIALAGSLRCKTRFVCFGRRVFCLPIPAQRS
jgi:hypothetical protein